MKRMNRREALGVMSAFAMLATVAEAQTGNKGMATSKLFKFELLPVEKGEGGKLSRAVMHGTLPTGEFVEMHQTTLAPGMAPHAPHKHANSEWLFVREGKLEFNNDGKLELAGPGDVIFAASNVMHGWKNVGDTPATYFDVAVGVQPGLA